MSTDNKSQCSQWCAIQPQGFPVVSYPLNTLLDMSPAPVQSSLTAIHNFGSSGRGAGYRQHDGAAKCARPSLAAFGARS